MWAFAIYDLHEKSIFCSRDRFGVKPFNFSIIDGCFIFASEIKSIISVFPHLKKPNYNVIANFCRTSVGAQSKETWFENIYRLEPATYLFIKDNKVITKRYWEYPTKINKSIDFNAAKDEYARILQSAVQLRMRSDVPVGFTLSSGIDSASIVSLLRNDFRNNINTYTAAFPDNTFDSLEKKNFSTDVEINEPALVQKLTDELGLHSTLISVNYTNYINDLNRIIWHLESGHGSPAIFPFDQVMSRAQKDVTVVLEGQGADELLGGYISNVYPIYIIGLLKKLKIKKAISEIKIFAKNYSLKTAFLLLIRLQNIAFIERLFFNFSGIDKLFGSKLKAYVHIKDYPNISPRFDDPLNKHLYKAHTGGLVNLLHYGDAISMAHSIESRLPFMDYRLVEFAFSLPTHYKVGNGMGKLIHRKSMIGYVPDFVLNNPLKFGFDSPLSHLFDNKSDNSPYSIIMSDICRSRKLFNHLEIEKMFDRHIQRKSNHSRILFRILSVELWFRNFIDSHD
jgi:asparagine synthase (glutamine-hydrolysing)